MAPTDNGSKAPTDNGSKAPTDNGSKRKKTDLGMLRTMALFFFGLNGALTLALLSAAASTWDVPAARFGFGTGALGVGIAAMAAALW